MVRGEAFPVCCGPVRYALARYVNHSDHPNALLTFDESGLGWMTLQADLAQGTEVLMDYNDNATKSRAASAYMLDSSSHGSVFVSTLRMTASTPAAA